MKIKIINAWLFKIITVTMKINHHLFKVDKLHIYIQCFAIQAQAQCRSTITRINLFNVFNMEYGHYKSAKLLIIIHIA